MELVKCDGGRSKYFKTEHVGDCATRAICNATGMDYKEVYDAINELAKKERIGKRKNHKSTARDGVYIETFRKYVEGVLGWKWHPTMTIGSGCTMHLNSAEVPDGILIVRTAKHYTCVKNKVLYDTYDCSLTLDDSYNLVPNKRCVYGYWTKE